MIGVEELVGIHDGDEVVGVGQVDDVVRISREHMDGLDVIAADLPFEYARFRVVQIALLNESVAGDDDEELPFGVVPMLALGDTGL